MDSDHPAEDIAARYPPIHLSNIVSYQQPLRSRLFYDMKEHITLPSHKHDVIDLHRGRIYRCNRHRLIVLDAPSHRAAAGTHGHFLAATQCGHCIFDPTHRDSLTIPEYGLCVTKAQCSSYIATMRPRPRSRIVNHEFTTDATIDGQHHRETVDTLQVTVSSQSSTGRWCSVREPLCLGSFVSPQSFRAVTTTTVQTGKPR